jgi:hypothetical protein
VLSRRHFFGRRVDPAPQLQHIDLVGVRRREVPIAMDIFANGHAEFIGGQSRTPGISGPLHDPSTR